MGKILDIFLIAALCVNLYNTYRNFEPATEIFGSVEIPTWVAVAIQVVLIFVLGYKIYKNNANNKQSQDNV